MAVAVMVSPVLTFWSLLINTKLSPGSNRNSSLPPTTLNWIKSPRSLWSAAKSISPSVAFVWNVTSMVLSSLLNEMLLCSKNEPCLKPGKWRSPFSEKSFKKQNLRDTWLVKLLISPWYTVETFGRCECTKTKKATRVHIKSSKAGKRYRIRVKF